MEKDNGSTQISEVVQGESNFYGMSSIESEDRYDKASDRSLPALHYHRVR